MVNVQINLSVEPGTLGAELLGKLLGLAPPVGEAVSSNSGPSIHIQNLTARVDQLVKENVELRSRFAPEAALPDRAPETSAEPEKKKPGRPKKTEAPAAPPVEQPAPAPAAAPAAGKVDPELFRAAARDVIARHPQGQSGFRAFLTEKFGVNSLTLLKEEQHGAALEALRAYQPPAQTAKAGNEFDGL